MNVTSRSYLTAGIAALGVGAIALAPVQPIPNPITSAPERVVSDLAVSLAAAVDPIQAWVNVFETSAANIEILGKFYMQNPFPILQTIGANWATYFEELQNGQGNLIPAQIWGNIQTFFEAPWDPGSTLALPNSAFGNEAVIPLGPAGEVTYLSNTQPAVPPINTSPPYPDVDTQSPQNFTVLILQVIAGLSQATPDDPVEGPLWELVVSPIAPLLLFLNTPYSGQLVSWLGPLLAPVVALTKSFTAVGQYFQEGKVMDALYELINIPANMTNAVLNGAGFLNLTPVLGQFFDLPETFKDVLIGFNVGGLLNAMPQDGSLKVNPEDPLNPEEPQPARPTVWAGGTGFDSFGIPGCGPGGGEVDVCKFLAGQSPAGLTNGLFGAGIGLGQFLAEQLLVTAPAPPSEAAADVVTKDIAAVEVAPLALTEVPTDEAAPAVVDEVTEEADPVVVDIPEVEVPAEVAAVPAPKPATTEASDDADEGSRASDSRRGGGDAD